MTLLRASLENQPLELDWHSRGRILIFSPPFTKPVELEEVEEEEAPGGDGQNDDDDQDGQDPPGDGGSDGGDSGGGPAKRIKAESTSMAEPVEPATEIPKEESMEEPRDAELVEPFLGCTAIDPSNAPKEDEHTKHSGSSDQFT